MKNPQKSQKNQTCHNFFCSFQVNNCKIELGGVLYSINEVIAEMSPDNNWFRDVIYEQEDLRDVTDSVNVNSIDSDDSDKSDNSDESFDSQDDKDYFQKMQKFVETSYGKQVFQQ